jgi:hypothetical protein
VIVEKLGELIDAQIGERRFPQMSAPRTDPRNAAARTLAAYLMGQRFVVAAGDDGIEKPFELKQVLYKFPTKGELEYPSAAITTPTSTQDAHTPFPLEATQDRYGPGTVLWRTAELVAQFQVDFFCETEADREAIAAALPGIFSPREDASGVMLRGPETYFCLPVRCTLVGDPERVDEDEAAFARERRLMVRIRSELDVVHLRKAVSMRRPVAPLDVLDPKA